MLADPAYFDGLGNGVIAMYDVTSGDLLFERHSTEQAQAFYPEGYWEDDTHVLAPVFQDGSVGAGPRSPPTGPWSTPCHLPRVRTWRTPTCCPAAGTCRAEQAQLAR